MLEQAFAGAMPRWLLLLAAGAALSCGDEAEGSGEPMSGVLPGQPGRAQPQEETEPPARAPPGVGSRALVRPNLDEPNLSPTHYPPPVHGPPVVARLRVDADAGVP